MVRRHSPILGEVKRHIQFEGDGSRIHQASGVVRDSNLQKMSAETEVSRMKIEDFLEHGHIKHLDQMAQQFSKSATEHFINVLEAITSETGNVVDGKGEEFNFSLMLEAIEKMPIDFDEAGRWKPPSIMLSSNQINKIKELARANPDMVDDHNRRLQEILRKKKDEFRFREANRKLVG